MARNKKVEILSNDKEVLHPMTDGDCVIFEDGQTLVQKLSEDDSVKYTPKIVNSSPMFKVGEGNTVDYSDNVLDGAYERATLQGQTYVNYIQESSADEVILPTPFTEYERTQHNTLTSDEEGTLGINLVGQSYVNALQHDSEEEFVVLGESLEFQEKKVEYTNEGQIKSAMLKGQTLVNLAKTRFGTSGSNVNLTRTEVENGMTYTVPNQATGYITIRTDAHELLKPSTTYTILFEIVENTIQDYNGVTVCGKADSYFSRNENQLYHNSAFDLSVGKKRLVVTTHNNISTYDGFGFGFPGFPRSGKEDAGVFTIKNVMVIEGDHSNEDIPYFEGMQSVTVSTKLENLCHKYNGGLAKNGKTFTTNSLADRCIKLVDYKDSAEATYGMKPNTKYLVQFKISNLVLDGLQGIGLQFSVGESDSTNYLFKNSTKNGLITANGIYRVVLTTTDLVSTSGVEIKGIGTEWESSRSILRSLKISEVMYVEYQNGMENWDLPYFEDYQVMKPIQVESVNKNLFNGELELGGYTGTTGGKYNGTDRVRSTTKTFLKAGTYYLSSSNATKIAFNLYNMDNTFRQEHAANSDRVKLILEKEAYSHITVVTPDLLNAQIQLEESDTATEYIPHQSKTTYSWDEVILRKVGDVEDTLDLTTGEWVQRIGEVTLDGSETWKMDAEASANNSCIFFTGVDFGGFQHFEHYEDRKKYQLCDKFKIKADAYYLDENCIMVNQDARIYCRILKTQLSSPDVTGFQEWLKTNNVKISTLLAKPIVHKVNLSRPNLQTYDDITHVHTKCLDGTLVPNIYLPSDISYPAILEPGKAYNVSINHTQVNADNPLKVNVGGTEITMTDSRMKLTTPATLANSNVSFTGKGNKIKESMLIKNSSLLTRDLPHFNGIGSVQLGKTIENLCASSYESTGSYGLGGATVIQTNDSITATITTKCSYVHSFLLIKPLENNKKYFIWSPNSSSNITASFKEVYNGIVTYGKNDSIFIQNRYAIITINQKNNQYLSLVIGNHNQMDVGTSFTIQRPIICEYEPGMEDWDWESIGYFTGTKNIGNEFMRIWNKNLFDGQLRDGYYSNGEFKANANNKANVNIVKIKPNTTYTISSDGGPKVSFYDINRKLVSYNPSTTNSYTFTTPSNVHYINFHGNGVTYFQIEESSTATTYTAHKHNSLYITKDQPINLTWEQGRINPSGIGDSYTNATNNAVSYGIRTKGLLNLKPNTTYRISLGDKVSFKYHIAVFDNSNNALPSVASLGISGDWISSVDTIFTTTKDAHKIGINVQKQNSGSITSPESVHAQVRLEEVTDIVLRSCSGKYDKLDLTRGVYTQNVGMVYLDGINALSQQITAVGDTYQPTDKTLKSFDIRCVGALLSSKCSCNKFPSRDGGVTSVDISFESVCIHSSNMSCRLTISTEKASTLEEFKLWLQDNPLEIIYALKTPIIHKVHIGNKNEVNTEITKPNDVFTLPTLYTEQTNIDLTNNGIMPKVQSRDYIAYPVLPMIGRTYTLQHNLTGGVSNLTVDLLGRTQTITYQNHKSLVYSPETMDEILHYELRISGKGKISKVMYIDGGYMDRDISYIEGMKNAVNPIVRNIGKSLISFDNVYSSYFINGSLSCVNNTITRLKDGYNDMQLFIYLINGKHYYFGLDGNIGVGGVQQPKIVFGKMYGWKGLAEQQKIAPNQDFIYRGQTGWTTLHMVNIDYINDIYITEVQSHENCEPYKENICYVDCGEIRLTPDMFEQGTVLWSNLPVGTPLESGTGNILKYDANNRIRLKGVMKAKPNTQYILSINDEYDHLVLPLDKQKCKTNYTNNVWCTKGVHIITTTADTQYITYVVARQGNLVIPSHASNLNFSLYELNSTINLRSLPHGVHDEIDLETGKYIQRVGEITFNGTENWLPGYSSWSNKYTYYNNTFVDIKVMKGDNGSGQAYYDAVRCSQLHRSYMGRLASALIDGICSYYYSGYQRIFISKQDCATVDELKLWLKENPITVQYELPEPIIKDIVIHNYPHSYEGGHVIIENGDPNTPIPAQLTYRAVTNRSGQIQQHTEQVEKQEREINELETLILANIHLSQTR